MKRHQTRWFINRVNKFIYRPKIKWCQCSNCQSTEVKIFDRQHAEYLKLYQDELGVRYQDKKL